MKAGLFLCSTADIAVPCGPAGRRKGHAEFCPVLPPLIQLSLKPGGDLEASAMSCPGGVCGASEAQREKGRSKREETERRVDVTGRQRETELQQ